MTLPDIDNQGLRALVARGREYRAARERLATEGTHDAEIAASLAAARLLDAALTTPPTLPPNPPPELVYTPLKPGQKFGIGFKYTYNKSVPYLPQHNGDAAQLARYWWARESEYVARQVEGYTESLLASVAERLGQR